MSENPCKTNSEGATQRINRYVEKFAVWILGIVISIGAAVWNKTENRIDVLEEKIVVLFQDKVSRQELKDELYMVRQQMDKVDQNMATRQDQLRGDILSRLELIMRFTTDNKLQ